MREVSIFVLVVMSICSSIFDSEKLIASAGLLAVLVSVLSKYIVQQIEKWKSCAAMIQQYVDVSLYAPLVGNKASNWGNVPSKTNVAEMIVSYKTIDTTSYRNWYGDYSTLSAEAQIFRSQSENVRWSSKLHRYYRNVLIVIGVCHHRSSCSFIFNESVICKSFLHNIVVGSNCGICNSYCERIERKYEVVRRIMGAKRQSRKSVGNGFH
jgi:hypothetical protein